MSKAIIICDNLVKIYKVADLEVVALQGLDLEVTSGNRVDAICCPNSALSPTWNYLNCWEALALPNDEGAPGNCSNSWGWAIRARTCPINFLAENSSAPPSRWPWLTSRACCWLTNLLASWTRSPLLIFLPYCAGSTGSWA